MTDLLSKFDSGELIALAAIVGGLLCGIVAIIASFWLDLRKHEMAVAFKQDMLNRGMSADEIQTVLDAGTKRSGRGLRFRSSCRA
jgi:hypothetical protein